jgi:hypothetical protein
MTRLPELECFDGLGSGFVYVEDERDRFDSLTNLSLGVGNERWPVRIAR